MEIRDIDDFQTDEMKRFNYLSDGMGYAKYLLLMVKCLGHNWLPIGDRTGGWFTLFTVIVTESGALSSVPSFTISWNESVVFVLTCGATKVGVGEVALESVTGKPTVWFHANAIGSPSWSKLAVPFSVTRVPSSTV